MTSLCVHINIPEISARDVLKTHNEIKIKAILEPSGAEMWFGSLSPTTLRTRLNSIFTN